MHKPAILMIGTCMMVACAGGDLTKEPFDTRQPVDRIRYQALVAWHVADGGQVFIELNNHKRHYQLTLRPSCTFALRQATRIRFSGGSRNHIAVGDDLVVGKNRCRIVEIAPSRDNPSSEGSAV